MFTVSEFSKIAQVPASQLRYYDRIDLFKPHHHDPINNYRYYSVQQLPKLNRIIALKAIGLSLEQIRRLVIDEVSADEIKGMLALRKAQIEQSLQEEANRLHIIEARLRNIDSEGIVSEDDVVVKTIPAQSYLSARRVVPSFFDGLSLIGKLLQLPSPEMQQNLGYLMAVIHSDAFRLDDVDVEIGFLVEGSALKLLDAEFPLQLRTLPKVETVISAVRIGQFENGYDSYAALGRWIENNGYRFAGKVREIFINPPIPGQFDEAVTEIQFPVVKRAFPPP